MNPLETYLRELRDIHSTGAAVPETSYYGCLERLLNEVGRTLKPKVRCVINLANRGAGIPDGGLFTPDQLAGAKQREERLARAKRSEERDDPDPMKGQPPSRGAIEVKSTADEVATIAAGEQVARYGRKYGLVLVTNYRDFTLVARDPSGDVGPRESYRLAGSEDEFWAAAGHPRAAAEKHGERFLGYLQRAMQHNAPLREPKDLAWFLASYARDALARVKGSNPASSATSPRQVLPALASLRKALEESLGMKFRGDRGEHFFESTLIQTLFYGVFSAWVLWSKEHPPRSTGVPPVSTTGILPVEREEEEEAHGRDGHATHGQDARATEQFDWMHSASYLRVPVLRKLFHEFSEQGQLEDMNLVEVLNWATAALNRVDRAAFFDSFQQHHAVQYFYEPFLEAYDPELRKQLGVWYTPPEIVQYMVRRVDRVLREELAVEDGLADPRVYVLDPCCGTGAFLVGVLDRIAATLRQRGGDALVSHDLKAAVQQRVFGFEILPAPYVVSHLQLGLRLADLGVPLSGKQRVGVYLTNALTGWEPPKEPQARLPFVEFQEEHDAADSVKRAAPILVILGNPPYNGFSDVAVDEERDLSTAYRETKKAPKPQGQGLNDLYVRFFRMAERRIVEGTTGVSPVGDGRDARRTKATGKGIVCYISNYSWLDGLSHTGMRERYIEAFDKIWIDCLNGDKYKTGKLTPEGKPDPSVFSTETNREGIQVGTAIALMVKRAGNGQQATGDGTIAFRHLWGKEKRGELLASADNDGKTLYESLTPPVQLGYPFRPGLVASAYFQWPLLPDLLPVSFPGIQASRDDVVIDIDKQRLVERMTKYFDPEIPEEDIRRIMPRAMERTGRFDPLETRRYLVRRGFLRENVAPILYRPFDIRWVYWEPETKLLDEKRAEYVQHIQPWNFWLAAVQQNRKAFDPPIASAIHNSRHVIERGANLFPLTLYPTVKTAKLFAAEGSKPQPNLSEQAIAYLAGLGYTAASKSSVPEGRNENSPALQGWETGPTTAESPAGTTEAHPKRNASFVPAGTPKKETTAKPSDESLGYSQQSLRDKSGKDLRSGAEALFYHILAVLHAPAYREENAGALRQDWPRIPLPATREALEASAALGRQIAALLDVTQGVKGVTTGAIRPELKAIGVITKLPPEPGGGEVCAGRGEAPFPVVAARTRQTTAPGAEQINDAEDLAVTAGWGNPGRGGITMPAGGKVVERDFTQEEREALTAAGAADALGKATFDIYLNDKVYWRSIPSAVWHYTLGGYQVIKKWLSYREHKILGRPLRADEARHVTEMARRIAAILLMAPALDENYQRAKAR